MIRPSLLSLASQWAIQPNQWESRRPASVIGYHHISSGCVRRKLKSDEGNAFGYRAMFFLGDKLFLELEVVLEFKCPDVWLLNSRIEAIRNVASFSGLGFRYIRVLPGESGEHSWLMSKRRHHERMRNLASWYWFFRALWFDKMCCFLSVVLTSWGLRIFMLFRRGQRSCKNDGAWMMVHCALSQHVGLMCSQAWQHHVIDLHLWGMVEICRDQHLVFQYQIHCQYECIMFWPCLMRCYGSS